MAVNAPLTINHVVHVGISILQLKKKKKKGHAPSATQISTVIDCPQDWYTPSTSSLLLFNHHELIFAFNVYNNSFYEFMFW